ncbi:MAG: biotin-dependent carboxyltransferase family protein [Pyrinomonadaceae bacterium]
MSLRIKKPGILTTLQDLGRLGWRRYGVNPSGAMDTAAARIANILVGNDDNAAVLEMHFPAAEIVFEKQTIFSLCGGDLGAELDGEPLTQWRSFVAQAGATLRFKAKIAGERLYIALRGGIEIPLWLGSSSTNLAAKIGGFEGRQLNAGDRLPLKNFASQPTTRLPAAATSLLPHYSRFPTVRVIPGAEFEYLSAESRQLLLSGDLTISTRSNRMGFLLMGQPLALRRTRELISAAVCFGTVQLLPDGQLIILMADQQTAGGYPRVAHIVSYDLPLVGQLGAGDKIAFHMTTLEEAEGLAVQFEQELSFLRVACKFAYR